jgi:hypothetical protein
MNVLIFSSFHQPPLFTGLNMEMIQQNLDKGNNVHYVDCFGSFKSCGFNTYKLKYMCELCKYREEEGLDLIKGEINRNTLSDLIRDEDREVCSNFLDGYKVINKDLRFENFDVGEAAYSSMISKTRDRDLNDISYKNILFELTKNSLLIYESLKFFIRNKQIEKLILFNGRWDYYKAAMAAANFVGIEVEIFENFRLGGYYQTFGNNLPHSIKTYLDNVESTWQTTNSLQEKQKVADNFFLSKRKGKAIYDKSYVKDQKPGKLPENYNKNKKTFVLYNSSDDEFAAVGNEFDNPIFIDQIDGIKFLVEYFKSQKDYQLIIRMHPNLKGLVRDYLVPLYELENKYDNIILIKPEDDTDTYELMNIADTVLSFGSTAGLEASYWGKPVILLGKAFYYYSNVAYVPKSKEEVLSYLNRNLQPHDKLNAQKFAYYYCSGGIKASFFNTRKNGDVFFKGNLLGVLPLYFKIYYKTLKFLKIKN